MHRKQLSSISHPPAYYRMARVLTFPRGLHLIKPAEFALSLRQSTRTIFVQKLYRRCYPKQHSLNDAARARNRSLKKLSGMIPTALA